MSGAPHGHVVRQHGILPQFSYREPQAASFGIPKDDVMLLPERSQN
jgi:hypothetical protein